MSLAVLMEQVQHQARDRNSEVLRQVIDRLNFLPTQKKQCNYQKIREKLCVLAIECSSPFRGRDGLLTVPHYGTAYDRLKRRISYKSPCGVCQACEKERM